MALQLGRARMINAVDCTIQIPLDCDIPESPSRTIFRVPSTNEKPSFVTSQRVKYLLALKIHELMSAGAYNPEGDVYALIQQTHEYVETIVAGLPAAANPLTPDKSWDIRYPDLVKHRLQISIITNAFLLSLHRPHCARHLDSLKHAKAAAIQILDSSQLIYEITGQHQHKVYTLVFYTIDAGLVLSALVSKYGHEFGDLQGVMMSLDQAINRLAALKSRNIVAIAGEKALRQAVCVARRNSLDAVTSPRDSRCVLSRQKDRAVEELLPSACTPDATPASAANIVEEVTPLSEIQSLSTLFPDTLPLGAEQLLTNILDDDTFTATWLAEAHDTSIAANDFNIDDFGVSSPLFQWP